MKTKKLLKKVSKKEVLNFIGKSFFFRTVTYHILGKVKDIVAVAGTNYFLLETGSSWVADSGRFSTAINTGELNEVEVIKMRNHLVNPASCVDILEWHHPLPTETK